MKYIKIDKDTFIEYDPDKKRAVVLSKKGLEAQKSDIEARLKDYKEPTDEDLLAWAKENYEDTDHSAEAAEKKRIETILKELK